MQLTRLPETLAAIGPGSLAGPQKYYGEGYSREVRKRSRGVAYYGVRLQASQVSTGRKKLSSVP